MISCCQQKNGQSADSVDIFSPTQPKFLRAINQIWPNAVWQRSGWPRVVLFIFWRERISLPPLAVVAAAFGVDECVLTLGVGVFSWQSSGTFVWLCSDSISRLSNQVTALFRRQHNFFASSGFFSDHHQVHKRARNQSIRFFMIEIKKALFVEHRENGFTTKMQTKNIFKYFNNIWS